MKVTSGSTEKIAQEIDELYKNIIEAGTFPVSSIKVAEASKVIENIQRDVNIALINELALIFDRMGISTHEVIEASSSKWNFIKFLPGLVGGHCIGVDPYYLSFKAEAEGYKPDLINTARQINDGMSKYVVDKTIKIMIKNMKTVKNANVLILGLAFKEDCPDTRNSKVIDIVKELKIYEVNISIYDPWVPVHEDEEINSLLIKNPKESQFKYDAIIIPVAHKEFRNYTNDDFKKLSVDEPIIIDIKNITDIKTWTL
jgi:UDP-N-acetyl-D-galactosamine dehydrogenase